MRIRTPGKIRDGLHLLGIEESCTYLLEGRQESMLINGGMNYSAAVLLDQFQEFGIDEQKITKILMLHAHFDHIGIVPFFKRRNPSIEVLGCARAWQILSMPKAIKTINEFSRLVAKHLDRLTLYEFGYDLDWDHDIRGKEVSEGDRLDLGDLEVEIYETPGHSSCSISAYVPSLKILFPSDGGGVPFKNTTIISGNSNFTQYQQSLEKLQTLDADVVCGDHYGCVVQAEAKRFIENTIHMAAQYRAYMESAYLKTRNIDAAAREVGADFCRQNPGYMVPAEIYEGVCRQMIRHLATALEEKSISEV
jgi:glyoxylase-like metal-dependent hydrolase (beta-lactamase superfamily II)